jgi:hypothetical protein
MTLFDDTAIARAVQGVIDSGDLPVGHTNALVATVDATGAQFIVGVQRQQGAATWQIQGLYRHDWSGNDSAGARVLVSW